MKARVHFWGLTLLLASILCPGCATTRSRSAEDSAGMTRWSEEEEARYVEALARFATGFSHDLMEQPDEALEQYKIAALANPAYEPVVLETARRLIRLHQPDEAIQILKAAARREDASGAVFSWLGIAYAQANRRKEAVEANQTAIRKQPDSFPAYQNLAQLYLQNGRTNDAIGVLKKASEQETSSPAFYLELADLFLRFSRLRFVPAPDASAIARQALEKAEALPSIQNPHALIRLADLYNQLGESKKAEQHYLEALQRYPDFPHLNEKLADLYLRSGDADKASARLESIVKAHPTNPQPYILLSSLALQQQDFVKAAEYLQQAIQLRPEFEEAYYQLARLQLTLNQPQEALDLLDKARGRFERSFGLEFYSALALSMLHEYSRALDHYTSAEVVARALQPEQLTPQFYFQYGATFERAGRHQEAAEQFRKALELDPEFAEAMNYLGYMWADLGIELAEAHDLIQKAVELDPDNAAFLDSLAWVLFKLKKPEEALPYMLRALEHAEEADPVLYDHLGDIYSELRQFDQAREAWEKALHLEPQEDAEKIRRKLESIATSVQSPCP